MVCKVF
jgi:hypothetical protein